VKDSINKLIQPEQRNRMRLNMSNMRMSINKETKATNGADEVARLLIEQIED